MCCCRLDFFTAVILSSAGMSSFVVAIVIGGGVRKNDRVGNSKLYVQREPARNISSWESVSQMEARTNPEKAQSQEARQTSMAEYKRKLRRKRLLTQPGRSLESTCDQFNGSRLDLCRISVTTQLLSPCQSFLMFRVYNLTLCYPKCTPTIISLSYDIDVILFFWDNF
jgi:hypothetical protein